MPALERWPAIRGELHRAAAAHRRRRPGPWVTGTAISRSSCSLDCPPRKRSSAQPAATHHGTSIPRRRSVISSGCQAFRVVVYLQAAWRKHPVLIGGARARVRGVVSHVLALPAGKHARGAGATTDAALGPPGRAPDVEEQDPSRCRGAARCARCSRRAGTRRCAAGLLRVTLDRAGEPVLRRRHR
jgi:hypothetical protein